MPEYLLKTASASKWKNIGLKKRSGVLAPLFSLHSKDSAGIGELRDLKLLIDWAQTTCQSIIQLLPMNEVGPVFCPYDSVSSFALEPAYLRLDELPGADSKAIQAKIKSFKKDFPAGKPQVDYLLKAVKVSILKEIFLLDKKSDPVEFDKFIKDNSYWLLNFALFKVIKSAHKGLPWYEWGVEYKTRQQTALAKFYDEHLEEVNFQMWVQWQLYRQFIEVKDYAKEKGVFIKGDLPILVSRDSADVWAHPEFFKLDFAAGAPPDMYCAKGQRWGMPTYEWERIAADHFCYLKEKLRYAENFYDMLRVDHVVGLFRIWSIPYNDPLENQGLHGFFDPRDESKWPEHGRTILNVILENTKMLVCAEDLGVIPWACTSALKDLGIPGNDVQRWMKDWDVRHDFLDSKGYRELAVSMLSTHDTTNWAGWWENESGTVDEELFIRKCRERGMDFNLIKYKLFDPALSRHGRLRWLNSIDSVDKVVEMLNAGLPRQGGAVPKEHLKDFTDLYLNTFQEKEKLWAHFKLAGPMREKCDKEIVHQALKASLESSSIFCINTLVDWLYLADIFKGDAYDARFNTPGTVDAKNWSLIMPIPLEELLKHKGNGEIKRMVEASGR